jgi:hypothetical protein
MHITKVECLDKLSTIESSRYDPVHTHDSSLLRFISCMVQCLHNCAAFCGVTAENNFVTIWLIHLFATPLADLKPVSQVTSRCETKNWMFVTTVRKPN